MRTFGNMFCKLLRKKLNRIVISISLLFSILIVLKRAKETQFQVPRTILNPPQPSESEIVTVLDSVDYADEPSDPIQLEKTLSAIVQNQILKIQNQINCSLPNFICGNFKKCGIGCEIHQRIGCVIMSYVLNMPFIHDDVADWSHPFLPIGSTCSPGPNTYVFEQRNSEINLRLMNSEGILKDEIQYPLANGISVPEDLGKYVDKISKNPFLWWIGQFTEYVMRLPPQFEKFLESYKNRTDFSKPIVGIYVKKDKIKEAMHHAEAFIGNKMLHEKRVFVSADDSTILQEIRTKYSSWKVFGFKSNRILTSQRKRKPELAEIIRDLMILSECDFIICGFTYDICKLLLEMLYYKRRNPENHLISLDGNYSFVVQSHPINTMFVWKIAKQQENSN